jgi:hypothetical protein
MHPIAPTRTAVSICRRATTLGALAGACLLAIGTEARAGADAYSWTAGNGFWFTASNWSPSGVPGTDPFNPPAINLGDLPGIQNATVLINAPAFSGSLGFSELVIASGMTLDMNGSELGSLGGSTTLLDSGTTMIVRPSAGPNFHDFTSAFLTTGPDTLISLLDNARMRIWDFESQGIVAGRGTVHLQGAGPAVVFNNRGTISGSANGGLRLTQEGTGRIDLDGSNGAGEVLLAAPFSQLTIEGDQLNDSFGGAMFLGSGSLLTMDLTNGWTADTNASISVTSAILGAAAQINGSPMQFGGDLSIGGSQGHLRTLADLTITATASISIGTNDILECDGETTILGGSFTLADGARIKIDGPTRMEGGSFLMTGPTIDDGVIDLNGDTEWDGSVSVDGVARQHGTATVTGPTVIEAGTMDLDGNTGFTLWFVEDSLIVEADAIDVSAAPGNWISAFLKVEGGINAKLDIRLTDPSEAWRSTGSIQLHGIGFLPVTRLAGSPLIAFGWLSISGGLVQVTADLSTQGATVSIADDSTLRLRGVSHIDAATTFHHAGMLTNGVNGSLTLAPGVETDAVGLTNTASLAIGNATPGIARVNRFTQSAAGSWHIDIGGLVAGSEHDRLDVDQNVTLAGTVLVTLADGFVPSPGDAFTILTWSGVRSGEFASVIGCYGARIRYEADRAILEFGEGGLTGDLNSDGKVNAIDVSLLLGQWGACPEACCNADLDGDGLIGANDLALLLGQWTA